MYFYAINKIYTCSILLQNGHINPVFILFYFYFEKQKLNTKIKYKIIEITSPKK